MTKPIGISILTGCSQGSVSYRRRRASDRPRQRRYSVFQNSGFSPNAFSVTKACTFLGQQGALSAAEIAEHIRATGRDINNRTVSFSLQALKKRGLAKSADGKWTHGYKPLPSRSEAASKRWNSRACTIPIS
jgi:hypothetical protein